MSARDLLLFPRRVVVGAIRLYQRTLSPDHGPLQHLFPYGVCKFRPTCSQYTAQAVDRFGITRGLFLGMKRILRCNPWAMGGIDEVPEKK